MQRQPHPSRSHRGVRCAHRGLITTLLMALLMALSTLCLYMGLCSYTGFTSQALAAPEQNEQNEQIDRVTLDLNRFVKLFETTTRDDARVKWSQPTLKLDLTRASSQGLVRVEFSASVAPDQLPARASDRWARLVADSAERVAVWVNDVPEHTVTRVGYHAVQLNRVAGRAPEDSAALSQRVKLTYSARLTRESSGALSGVIPLPPVAAAQVTVVGMGRARVIPTLGLNARGEARDVSLKGALAVMVPEAESGLLLQREDLSVTLHESGEGADVELEITALLRGEMKQGWIQIAPARDALLSAESDGAPATTRVAHGWHAAWVEGGGSHTIKAKVRTLIDRSSGQPQLTLSPQLAPRAHLSVTLPGEREIKTTPAIPLISSTTRDESGGGEVAQTAQVMTRASADLPPLQTLTLRWTEKRITPEREEPEFLSETYQLFSLQEGLLKGEARVELDVIKGELKRIELEVPPEVVLYHLSGARVEGWVTLPLAADAPAGASRTVQVTFGEALSGQGALSVKWQRVLSNNEALEMPLIRPLEAFQESGVIALYDGDRVGFTPAKTSKTARGEERLIPVGQESIPQHILQLKSGDKVSQAFRHVQAPTTLKTSTTTERARELRFDAQLDTLYSLRDGAVRAQSQLLVNLKSGRLESLVIALPSVCAEPQVNGPSINRVEPIAATPDQPKDIKRYQVRFTRRLEGAVTLDIDVEQLIDGDLAALQLPRLVVEGAELTQGYLGLSVESGLEVTPADVRDLRRVAPDELPRSIRLRASHELLYGYRFSRDWSMSAQLKLHKMIETLSAEATRLAIQTYLLKSGQRVNVASYTIKNRDRRAVKIKLPADARVQSVLVNNQEARARAEGDMMSVPVPLNTTSLIEVRYEIKPEDAEASSVKLTSPTSDMRTTNIMWSLYFSDEHQIWSWSSELAEASGGLSRALNFSGISNHQSFQYDLMAANRDPLTLEVTLSEVISDQVMRRLNFLLMLSFLFIGFARGLALLKRAHPVTVWGERLCLAIIPFAIGASLYQEPWFRTESALFDGVTMLISAAISVWLAGYAILAIKMLIARAQLKRAQRDESPKATQSELVSESADENAGTSEEDEAER